MQVQDPNGQLFRTSSMPVNPKKIKELRKEAQEGAYKKILQDKIIEQKKLERFAKKSTKLIYQLETVWPFQLFPVRIAIHEDKVDVIDKTFFKSVQIIGTTYARLMNVKVNTSLFFAEIDFEFEGFPMNKPLGPVRFLRKKQAMYAVQLMNGLIICTKEGIDTTKIDDVGELRQKLLEIGYSHKRGIV